MISCVKKKSGEDWSIRFQQQSLLFEGSTVFLWAFWEGDMLKNNIPIKYWWDVDFLDIGVLVMIACSMWAILKINKNTIEIVSMDPLKKYNPATFLVFLSRDMNYKWEKPKKWQCLSLYCWLILWSSDFFFFTDFYNRFLQMFFSYSNSNSYSRNQSNQSKLW